MVKRMVMRRLQALRNLFKKDLSKRNLYKRNLCKRDMYKRDLSMRNLFIRDLCRREWCKRDLSTRDLFKRGLSKKYLCRRDLSKRNFCKRNWYKISASADGGPRSRSAHARPFARPPIDTSGNFPAQMSAESSSNISPKPLEIISEVSEP